MVHKSHLEGLGLEITSVKKFLNSNHEEKDGRHSIALGIVIQYFKQKQVEIL